MSENLSAIKELPAVIEEQQELLRLILWVMSQGPIVFRGQKLNLSSNGIRCGQ